MGINPTFNYYSVQNLQKNLKKLPKREGVFLFREGENVFCEGESEMLMNIPFGSFIEG